MDPLTRSVGFTFLGRLWTYGNGTRGVCSLASREKPSMNQPLGGVRPQGPKAKGPLGWGGGWGMALPSLVSPSTFQHPPLSWPFPGKQKNKRSCYLLTSKEKVSFIFCGKIRRPGTFTWVSILETHSWENINRIYMKCFNPSKEQ